MELQCPQCGKWMAVSQEELVIHDSQVVCPQCLAVCRCIDGKLEVRDDSDAPYRHTATVDSGKHESTKFCHNCGKQLPSGISFCPYCGADLSAPFDNPKPTPAARQPEPAPVKREVPQQPSPKPAPERPAVTAERQPTHSQVEDKLRTISRHYNNGPRPHLHQNGTMPSRSFKIMAYAVIAILLILLACIIIAGLNIEPATIE